MISREYLQLQMGQRNMMIDLEMEQQSQGYVHLEPCIRLGSLTSFPKPDTPFFITALGSVPSLEAHPLQESYESAMFYEIPQHHVVQHPHPHSSNVEVGISPAPNLYVPCIAAYALPSQLPSSSNQGFVGGASDEYEGGAHFMDPTRGSYTRKNVERALCNPQYLSPSAASCSFAPLNINPNDAAPLTFPQFSGTSGYPQLSQRSVGNRLGAVATADHVISRCQNDFVQSNFITQPCLPPSSIWFDQQQMSNGRTDGAPSPLFQTHSLPYMHGSNIDSGSIESGNISPPIYHEMSSSRNPATFIYPSSPDPRHHYFSHHLSSPPIQRLRDHNTSIYPHMALVSFEVPPSNYTPHSSMHDGSEMGTSLVGPVRPTGFRIYQHHQDGEVPEPTSRHHVRPHLRVMLADEVALFEVGDYDTGNYIDHHRDLRLDIEDMSYEDLLALSERIGTVNTGLTEETVTNHLKTRIYLSTRINLKEAPPMDLETDSCTICQENYRNQEKIGTLDCGHEYHAECLKKWLFIKNVCPICKSEALVSEKKDT